MFQTFHRTCPTEDKEVELTVIYNDSSSLEDTCHVYTKCLIHSCSGNELGCGSCQLYNTLPNTIKC